MSKKEFDFDDELHIISKSEYEEVNLVQDIMDLWDLETDSSGKNQNK